MPDRIQRNRTTGEYRVIDDMGNVRPYTPPAEPTQPEMYHPGASDTPTEAFLGELGRTGKEAAIGLARSPWDLLKGTFGLAAHPVESMKGMAHAVSNPRETIQQLGDNPREAGSALGQLLLGRYAVPAVAPKVPGAVSAVGRGAEAVGTTLAKGRFGGGFGLPGLGAAEAIFRSDPMGVAVAAAPYALKYGGRGLQRAGAALEGLKRGATVAEEAAPITEESRLLRPARVSREAPYRAEPSAPLEPPAEPELSVVEPPTPEAQVVPGAADVDELMQQIPETVPASQTIPTAWEPYLENPAMQGLRQVLEELRRRPTPGLTNPMGR